MREKTPQELGYDFDYELAGYVNGERHTGSGNRTYQRLDASGSSLIVSGKYTSHASVSIKETDLDELLMVTVGPESTGSGLIPVLAHKFASGRMVGTMDLLQLLEWIKKPPELIVASKQDNLRRTARTPSFLRED